MINKILSALLCAALLVTPGVPTMAETPADTSQVASSEEMTTVDDVTWEGMDPVYATDLYPGSYEITVDSSSSMFSITHCLLTVKEDGMSAVLTMGGKGYLYLYPGTPEEAAAAPEEEYIPFIENAAGDHTFTFPVEALDAPVKCAAFSKKKEKWYDRTLVFRASSLPTEAYQNLQITTAETLGLEDGVYSIDVTLEGGSGKASIESAELTVKDKKMTAVITWSSSHYDYMLVNDEKYLNLSTEGNSTFEIPISGLDIKLPVVADTTAMSKPHEIEYTLYFDSSTLTPNEP